MNVGYDAAGRSGIVPTFGQLSLNEAEALLNGGLLGLNLYQLQNGVPGIKAGILAGDVIYDPYDPDEHWQSIREIWEAGGRPPSAVLAYREREGLGPMHPMLAKDADGKGRGDCEDLSTAIAAQETHEGRPAKARIQRIRPGLAHVVVQDQATGALSDPNITGGMGK